MTEVATRAAVSGPQESDWSAAVTAIRELAPTGRVLLICHVNPDGDALGSMLGFALGLQRLAVPHVRRHSGARSRCRNRSRPAGIDLLVAEARRTKTRYGDRLDGPRSPARFLVDGCREREHPWARHHRRTQDWWHHWSRQTRAGHIRGGRGLLDRLDVPLDRRSPSACTRAGDEKPARSSFDIPHPGAAMALVASPPARRGRSAGGSSTPGRSAPSSCSPRCWGGQRSTRPRRAAAAWCGRGRRSTT